MHAKLILNFIRGKTVDYASKKIQRWYRESYDDSPKAFSFLKKDVEMVLDMVYQYHAQVIVAQDLLDVPLSDNTDYLSVCVRLPKRGEMDDLDELIKEVEEMLESSTGLRTRVRARVINHIETSQVRLNELKRQYREEEAQGLDFDLLKYTARAISMVSASRDRFRANKISVERTGNQIDEQLAEALALLDDVKARIRDSQDGFAVIVRECNVWMNNWNRWDFRQGQEAR